jgi:hypothetical protein
MFSVMGLNLKYIYRNVDMGLVGGNQTKGERERRLILYLRMKTAK